MVILDYIKNLFTKKKDTEVPTPEPAEFIIPTDKAGGGGKSDDTYIGCVRGSKVVNLIRATLAYAQTLGYDDVGPAERVSGGWIVNGITYPEELETQDQSNEKAMLAELGGNLPQFRAFINLSSPTNAQVIAAVKLLCRAVIIITRYLLRRFEATT